MSAHHRLSHLECSSFRNTLLQYVGLRDLAFFTDHANQGEMKLWEQAWETGRKIGKQGQKRSREKNATSRSPKTAFPGNIVFKRWDAAAGCIPAG